MRCQDDGRAENTPRPRACTPTASEAVCSLQSHLGKIQDSWRAGNGEPDTRRLVTPYRTTDSSAESIIIYNCRY